MRARSSAVITPIPYTVFEALTLSIISQSVALVLVGTTISVDHVSWVVGLIAAASVVCALLSVVSSWCRLHGFDPTPGSEEHVRALETARFYFNLYLVSSYVLAVMCVYSAYDLIHPASIAVAVPLLSVALTFPFPILILHLYVGILHGGDHIMLEHLQGCSMVQVLPGMLSGVAEKLGWLGRPNGTVNAQDPDQEHFLPLYYLNNKTNNLLADRQELCLGPTAVETNLEGKQ